MKDEELFILLVQQLGYPQPLMERTGGHGKNPTATERPRIDYVLAFAATCAMAGRPLMRQQELERMHTKWAMWYVQQHEARKLVLGT